MHFFGVCRLPALRRLNVIPHALPPPYYLPDQSLVGLDQAANRWITSHNMGAVLWTVTQVWRSRGQIVEDVLQGAREVADWLLTYMRPTAVGLTRTIPDGDQLRDFG